MRCAWPRLVAHGDHGIEERRPLRVRGRGRGGRRDRHVVGLVSLEAPAEDVARAAMEDRQLGIDARHIGEGDLHLGVALLLVRAGEAIDRQHHVTHTRQRLAEWLPREKRRQTIDLERRELVVHVVGMTCRETERTPRQGHRARVCGSALVRVRVRGRGRHDVVEHGDRAGACESARRSQEHAREHEPLRGRGVGDLHALCLLDGGAQRPGRARQPRGMAEPADMDVARRAFLLGGREGVGERRGRLRLARHVEATRIRVECTRRGRALHLRPREIRRADTEAAAPHVLARDEHAVPERGVDRLHGSPEQRQIAYRPEVTHCDGAAQTAEDRAPSQLGARRVRCEAAPYLEPGRRARAALEPLRCADRDVRGQAHDGDLIIRTS